MRISVNDSRIPSNVLYFKNISEIEIEKEDLFKLGIFKHAVPPTHVNDNDFFYLRSKIPAYIELYSDFIDVSDNSIINLSSDDRMMKDVSEIVGIALGIKFTIDCFSIRQELINKIPVPESKIKYMDYKFNYNNMDMELETKGTTSKDINSFVKDITEKKSKSGASFKYGTVAVLSKPNSSRPTELHICDDPPEEGSNSTVREQIPWHYISALGYLLDNKYYNTLVKLLIKSKKQKKGLIKIKERFFGNYNFQNESYLGEFFDYRLNFKNISSISSHGKNETIDQLFQKITLAVGKHKIFIGIHSKIVDLILQGAGLDEILKLQFSKINKENIGNSKILRDSDGIIVVIVSDNTDSQIEEQFPESEVKNRLNQFVRFEAHDFTLCGSPCRSREILGKPCAIKTSRGTCHFHR